MRQYLLVIVALLSSPGTARAQEMPPGAAALITRMGSLLQQNDSNGIAALAAKPGGSFAWLRHGARGRTSGWSVAPLLLPAAAGEKPVPVAIFSMFHTVESIGDHFYRLTETDAGWRLGDEIAETDTLGYRVRDHRLTVRYDLPTHGATITDEVTIERVSGDGPVLLRLSSDMKVDAVAMAGKAIEAQKAPGAIAFAPPRDRAFTVSLAYHGTVNHPGSDYVTEREAVLVSYWYAHIARLPAKHGVAVTVPKGWLAIGEGDLQDRKDDATTSTFTFRNEVPTCFFSLDAAAYTVTERESGGRKLSCYQIRPDVVRAKAGLDVIEKALPFYEARFGKFPYSHYTLVETVGPFGGALEAYSFATFNGGAFGIAAAHELSHTWWGGVVPNPYTRSMWNESFANYSDNLFRRLTGAHPDAHALTNRHQDTRHGRGDLTRFQKPIDGSFDTEDFLENAVGYGKGSQVLAMLEDLLGTETMLRCMRNFYEQHPRGEAGSWDEFAAAVRRTTGQDYGWFFSQWLERGGVPVLKLEKVRSRARGGRYEVEADVVQVGEPYRLSLPVSLTTTGGTTVRQSLPIRGETAHLRFEADAPPKALSLDPEGNLLLAGAEAPENVDPLSFTFTAAVTRPLTDVGRRERSCGRAARAVARGSWLRPPPADPARGQNPDRR